MNVPDTCIVDYRELSEEDKEHKLGYYVHEETGRWYHLLFFDGRSELVPTQTDEEYEAM